MESSRKCKVLLADDSEFCCQVLKDMLEKFSYEVVTVENGVLALDKLKEPDSQFDLIILDLLMPIKSGKEVLEDLREDEILRKIPVIVVSAVNDQNIISEWLELGAKDFISKPIRIKHIEGFQNFLINKGETEVQKCLKKYTLIKNLASGANSTVDLVKHNETNEIYALKTTLLENLSENEKQSAKLEVQFLRVLAGPSLIKFHHSYIENDKIYIIMEYAEGGSLADKILQLNTNKETFDTDQILNWISQVIIGIMQLHCKNILHKDIRSQHLLLTKDNIVKICDFSKSKQQDKQELLPEAAVGAPYYMAPEVCRDESYSNKAEVWSIGVILYELAILKKPFDSDTIVSLFDKIQNQPLDLTEEDIDADIKMLITSMLEKDQEKRPSIWDLAEVPCIESRIATFIKDNDLEGKLNMFVKKPNKSDQNNEVKEEEKKWEISFDLYQLNLFAQIIQNDIRIEQISRGCFKKRQNCASGYEIFKWVKENIENDDRKANEICQAMMDQETISRIDQITTFENKNNLLYTFRKDKENIASNLSIPWNGEVSKAIEVSKELISLIEVIDNEFKPSGTTFRITIPFNRNRWGRLFQQKL